MWLFKLYGWRGAFLIIAGIQLNGCVLGMMLGYATNKIESQVEKQDDIVHGRYTLKVSSQRQCIINKPVVKDTDNATKGIPVNNHTKYENIPSRDVQKESHKFDFSFLHNRLVIVFFVAHIFKPFGQQTAAMWLPMMGVVSGASDDAAALLVSVNSE